MKKQKGSYTVEAVIVMSTIIFIIFAIVSAFLLLYQNAVMYYVASQAAQEGAVMWTDMSHNLDGDANGRDSQGLYYRIGELFGGGAVGSKKETIKSWAEEQMKSLTPDTLIGSGASAVNVDFHNYFVRQVVEVTITKEIDIPFKEIAQYFDKDLDLRVSVQASLAEPAEFIRNIDYGVELSRELWKSVKGSLNSLFQSKK